MARLLLLTFALAGCSVIHGDDYEQDRGCDLELHVREFSPHVNDVLEVRLTRPDVDGERRLEALAIFDRLGVLDMDLVMPNSVLPRTDAREGLASVEFFADFDHSGDLSEADHSWILDDACVEGPEEFPHVGDFRTPREVRGEATSLVTVFCGDDLPQVPHEVRLTRFAPDAFDAGESVLQAVGFYRVDGMGSTEAVALPGIVNLDSRYTIEVLQDDDGDGEADVSEDEKTWTASIDASLETCGAPIADLCRSATVLCRRTAAGSDDVVYLVRQIAGRSTALLAPRWVDYP